MENENDSTNYEIGTIKRIDVSGLPNYNFAHMYMAFKDMKNIHPELNYSNAIAALGAIAYVRLYAYTKNIYGEYYTEKLKTNMFRLNIAGSGEGKNLSLDSIEKIISEEIGNEIFIDLTSPEKLVKDLSSSITTTRIERKTGKDTNETTEKMITSHVDQETGIIPNGCKNYWCTEIGAAFVNMNKSYMAETKPLWCDLYSSEKQTKSICGDKAGDTIRYDINTEDLYFGVNGSTTP